MQRFVDAHRVQLKHFGVEQRLWPSLFEAFCNEDAPLSDFFECSSNADGVCLRALEDLPAGEHVWKVPHMIVARTTEQLMETLQRDPGLLMRLASSIQAIESDDDGDVDQPLQPNNRGAEADLTEAASGLPCTFGPVHVVAQQQLTTVHGSLNAHCTCGSAISNQPADSTVASAQQHVPSTCSCGAAHVTATQPGQTCISSSSSSSKGHHDCYTAGDCLKVDLASSTSSMQSAPALPPPATAQLVPHHMGSGPACGHIEHPAPVSITKTAAPTSSPPQHPLPASDAAAAPASSTLKHPLPACNAATAAAAAAAALAGSTLELPGPASSGPEVPESILGALLASLQGKLLQTILVFELQGPPAGAGKRPSSQRFKYVLGEPACCMQVAVNAAMAVVPFVHYTKDKSWDFCSVMWLRRPVAAGEEVSRGRLPLGMADYSSREYWEAVYQGGGDTGDDEWYCSNDLVVATVLRSVGAESRAGLADAGHFLAVPQVQALQSKGASLGGTLLVPGCGTSLLGYQLWQAGTWECVLNVDYVDSVVQAMRARYMGRGLAWEAADVTDLGSLVRAGEVDCVVDKATLDAMLTSAMSTGGVAERGWRTGLAQLTPAVAYLQEMGRVLRADGVLVVVSLRPPASFQQLLALSCGAGDGGDLHSRELGPGAVAASEKAAWAGASQGNNIAAGGLVPGGREAMEPRAARCCVVDTQQSRDLNTAARDGEGEARGHPASLVCGSWWWEVMEEVSVPVYSRPGMSAITYVAKKCMH